MKIIKVFLAFFLFVNLIGCTVNNNKQETKSESIPTTKKPQKMVIRISITLMNFSIVILAAMNKVIVTFWLVIILSIRYPK